MKLKLFVVTSLLFLFSAGSFAQAPVASPAVSAIPAASVKSSPISAAAPVASPSISPALPTVMANPSSDAFLGQVVATVKQWGGLAALLRIAAVIALLIASMKVSIINKYVWSKLGAFQVYMAPLLGLIGGLLSLGVSGPVTLASVFTYASAGAGAVFLHEILDSLKAIPALGSLYVSLINMIEGALGGPASQLAATAKTDASAQQPPSA